MTDSFAVHIGGGAYIDASGKIVFGAPTNAQVYQAPKGFRLDAKKLQDTFKDLSDILPRNDEAKKKWMEWGVPENVVNFLGKVAGVVGIVATAVATYMWALDILITIFDLITDKDKGMSPELAKTLFGLKNQLKGKEQIERAEKMIGIHSEFDGRIDRMRGLLTRLVVEKPIGATRAQIFADMQTLVNELATHLSRLRDQEWATTYDKDAYIGRAHLYYLFFFERSDGSLSQVPQESPNLTVFDYRLGVPMLLYGATTFTALLQIAMPWFRSAGMYAGPLLKTADAIDRFVLQMQNESICRTEYTPEMVMQMEDYFKNYGVFKIPWSLSHTPGTYPVGAFDLVSYSDVFLMDQYINTPAGENPGQRGLFNYDWYPPEGTLDAWGIASAANEQARQDYTNLQVSIGMFRLISMAAWLRFLSTPPDRSQTVLGFAEDSRSLKDEMPTTAKSPSIFPVGVIEHDATLKRYDARNRVRITTQEPGYVPAFRYRIVLRTISSLFSDEGWNSGDYIGDVWRATYEPTQGDPRCKRLRTELRQDMILSQVVLYEGPSPSHRLTCNGDETLKAATFDWYVPVVTPWNPEVDILKENLAAQFTFSPSDKKMLGTGGVSIHILTNEYLTPVSMKMMSNPAPLVATVVDEFTDFGYLTKVSLDKAERRHVKIEEVVVRWQLNWSADKLEVKLFGQPNNRSFQVYVVVEETVYSGEILPDSPDSIRDVLSDERLCEQIHTPFVAEMVNQLVFVPEEFFKKELKALEDNAKMWSRFLLRYVKRAPIGPGDPIKFLQESIRTLTSRSLSTATLATTFNTQIEFAKCYAPDILNTVLQETQYNTGFLRKE